MKEKNKMQINFVIGMTRKEIKMNEDTHVYCTRCKWLEISEIDNEYFIHCPFENTCDIGNCEDSMAYKHRPNYEERK